MGRAPCCEKMGLKKGPWTPEEDHILIDYITRYGHGNWRALPKQAGLLRCGKSCRLRWTNYLRPDIKRGNLSKDEEDTIIKLHQTLGNRWSAIAAKLPGRTDNEIKNVWNTHLRKRANIQISHPTIPITKHDNSAADDQITKVEQFTEECKKPLVFKWENSFENSVSGISASLTSTVGEGNEYTPVDESFWSELFSGEYSSGFSAVEGEPQVEIPVSQLYGSDSNIVQQDGMDLWYDFFERGGEIPEI